MANRRMFSLDVVGTDRFLDMPTTTQCLYFHLGMRADDEGFVSSPKLVIRTLGCNEDDFKVLIAKGYLIPFEGGVVVISDWNVNNWIRPDRKHSTRFTQELSMLEVKNDVYTLVDTSQPIDNQLTTTCHTENRLGKDRLGKDNITVSKDTVRQTEVQRIVEEWNKLESYGIKSVSKLSPSSKRYQSLTARIKEYSLEDVLKAIENIKQSKFLQGKADSRKQWVITFDWFVLPNNFPKVLDGNYTDKEQEEPEEDDRSIYRTDYTELYEQIMKEGKPIEGPFK